MRRILQDLLLIIVPFAALSIFFFLGEQPRYGVAFIVVTLLATWYVRPRRPDDAGSSSVEGGTVDSQPTPHPGAGGAGAGM